MSDKRRRLQEMARYSDRTPKTWWDYGEFAQLWPAATTRWWVRSLADQPSERYRHSQGPWSPHEVDGFFAQIDPEMRRMGGFVIQEYVEPAIAGVSLCTSEFLLSEGISGAAAPLLRLGAFGDMIASHDDSISWRLCRGALDVDTTSALERAHGSIPRGANALWEWIVSESGDVYHVDRKELDISLLDDLPRGGPPERWLVGPTIDGSRKVVMLPDTSIRYLEQLAERSIICIAGGSPMAHLCFEAVRLGHSIVLYRSLLTSAECQGSSDRFPPV